MLLDCVILFRRISSNLFKIKFSFVNIAYIHVLVGITESRSVQNACHFADDIVKY